jgi:inosose dehydratase
VLTEMRSVGLTSTELGAIGWLPTDPTELKTVLDGPRRPRRRRVRAAHLPRPRPPRETLAEAEEMAALLQDIGAQNFVTAVVNDPEDWSRPELSEDQWVHLFSMLDEIEGVTAAHGVRQVVHPHADTLIQTAEEVERFLQSSSSAMCLDTGHLAVGGADPVAIADRYASRIGLVALELPHLRMRRELRLMAAVRPVLFATLGDGDVPVTATITSLERQGYDGLYVLEQDVAITDGEPPLGEGPVRNVAKNVAFLRSLDASLGATVRPGNAGVADITNHRPRPDINHLRGNYEQTPVCHRRLGGLGSSPRPVAATTTARAPRPTGSRPGTRRRDDRRLGRRRRTPSSDPGPGPDLPHDHPR